ncbi:MAG TPA: hypothetical protein VLH35_07980 [Candidatus Acidoferrales bacterium]|nr:hypothetical protein [Candidatus Acidoferrales bacterium]
MRLFAIEMPASNPTSDILNDNGTRTKSAIKKITIATIKTSAESCIDAIGIKLLIEPAIPQPCTSNPTAKPAAPSKAPNRLVKILAPTAGPTQAERLLPETNATAKKTKTTSNISKNNFISLENRCYN